MDRIYTMALRIALSKTRRYGKDPNYLCFFPQKLEKRRVMIIIMNFIHKASAGYGRPRLATCNESSSVNNNNNDPLHRTRDGDSLGLAGTLFYFTIVY